ncbi:patatin-like phospholipase family protein [Mesorhizobium sp. M0146]|uniref:patatin-like phospholipase family protein n=1 Tax=unclassified Mesorhizobium TaxID=325217 RepID=UPI003337CCFC
MRLELEFIAAFKRRWIVSTRPLAPGQYWARQHKLFGVSFPRGMGVVTMAVGRANIDAESRDISFDDVFGSELYAINARRRKNHRPEICDEPHGFKATAENDLTGLALSGGGVRSAAFCLGALQGLQSKQIIGSVDYLSTVSGGGYTGSTLTIGLSEDPDVFPFGRADEDSSESPIVKHLRDNSRYLLQNGLPSLVTALAVYARGLASNAVVVIPILMFLGALLVALNADTGELVKTRALLVDLTGMLGMGTLRVSLVVLCACAAGLLLYAVLVSIIPYAALNRRKKGTAVAGTILAIAGVLVILDLHAALTGFRFKLLAQGVDSTASDGSLSGWLVTHVKAILLWLSPVAALLLPYVNGIAAKATSGDGGGWTDLLKRVLSRLLLLAIASLVPLILWITVLQLAFWGTALVPGGQQTGASASFVHAPYVFQWFLGAGDHGTLTDYSRWQVPLRYALLGVAFLLLWPFINVNANSLHQLYRDRLGSAFFVDRKDLADPNGREVSLADAFKLSDIKTDNAPYHLINAALNVPGSKFANRRGRNADFFLFSPRYVGSEATGYIETTKVEEAMKELSLGTAVAVSGAAAAPNMGMASLRPLSLSIALLNVRLGYWLRHPRQIAHGTRIVKSYPGPVFLLSEAFSKSGLRMTKRDAASTETGFVFLTDGGHIENLGVYGLLRRRCKLIIAIDAEADPTMTFPSLVQLERFARIDLNVRIDLGWGRIAKYARDASGKQASGPHVAIGVIHYPSLVSGGEPETGVLIYLKSSLSGDENDYILSYAAAHRQFPHETTADQLFSEEQFEVYRALGEHVAARFITGLDTVSLPDDPDALETVKRILPMVSF